jgi:hypothetical protein
MPTYEWQGSGQFWNGRGGFYVAPGEVVDLPESVAQGNSSLVPVEEKEESEEEPESEAVEESETYICGSTDTQDGTPCEINVDSPDETCWNH